MQLSKLSLFSFGILPQRMLMDENLANTDLSFKRQNKRKNTKGTREMYSYVIVEPPCLYVIQQHTNGNSQHLLVGQILILLTPPYM